jgi:hypothetical protein
MSKRNNNTLIKALKDLIASNSSGSSSGSSSSSSSLVAGGAAVTTASALSAGGSIVPPHKARVKGVEDDVAIVDVFLSAYGIKEFVFRVTGLEYDRFIVKMLEISGYSASSRSPEPREIMSKIREIEDMFLLKNPDASINEARAKGLAHMWIASQKLVTIGNEEKTLHEWYHSRFENSYEFVQSIASLLESFFILLDRGIGSSIENLGNIADIASRIATDPSPADAAAEVGIKLTEMLLRMSNPERVFWVLVFGSIAWNGPKILNFVISIPYRQAVGLIRTITYTKRTVLFIKRLLLKTTAPSFESIEEFLNPGINETSLTAIGDRKRARDDSDSDIDESAGVKRIVSFQASQLRNTVDAISSSVGKLFFCAAARSQELIEYCGDVEDDMVEGMLGIATSNPIDSDVSSWSGSESQASQVLTFATAIEELIAENEEQDFEGILIHDLATSIVENQGMQVNLSGIEIDTTWQDVSPLSSPPHSLNYSDDEDVSDVFPGMEIGGRRTRKHRRKQRKTKTKKVRRVRKTHKRRGRLIKRRKSHKRS